jgi:hypothetical protein
MGHVKLKRKNMPHVITKSHESKSDTKSSLLIISTNKIVESVNIKIASNAANTE